MLLLLKVCASDIIFSLSPIADEFLSFYFAIPYSISVDDSLPPSPLPPSLQQSPQAQNQVDMDRPLVLVYH